MQIGQPQAFTAHGRSHAAAPFHNMRIMSQQFAHSAAECLGTVYCPVRIVNAFQRCPTHAFGFGWMTQTMAFFKRHIRVVNLIGGGLLILIGLLMVTGIWSQIMFSLQAVMANFGTIL